MRWIAAGFANFSFRKLVQKALDLAAPIGEALRDGETYVVRQRSVVAARSAMALPAAPSGAHPPAAVAAEAAAAKDAEAAARKKEEEAHDALDARGPRPWSRMAQRTCGGCAGSSRVPWSAQKATAATRTHSTTVGRRIASTTVGRRVVSTTVGRRVVSTTVGRRVVSHRITTRWAAVCGLPSCLTLRQLPRLELVKFNKVEVPSPPIAVWACKSSRRAPSTRNGISL